MRAIDQFAFEQFCFPNARQKADHWPLTDRQKRVYNMLKNNCSFSHISDSMGISYKSVGVYVTEIRAKGWDV